MLKLTFKPLLTLVLFASAVFAIAESDLFKTLDTDQSGGISVSEASVHSVLSEMFVSLDTDQDGELSLDEFKAADLEG